MANRFYDIILVLAMVSASIGLVNASGLFDVDYMSPPPSQSFEVEDLKDLAEQGGDSQLDYFTTILSWLKIASGIIKDMLISFLWVYPLIVDVFGAPEYLGGFIQVGVIMIYIVFFVQFISGRGWRQYES